MLHEQRLVEHGEARQLDWLLAEGAGLGEPAAVERRVGGGVADHGLQALLLVGGELGAWPLLAADLGPGQPQGRGRVGQAPPVIANLAVHRILRSCCVPSLLAEGWVVSKTASSSSHPMRRATTTSTAWGWVSRSRPSPTSIAFQASATWLAVTSAGQGQPTVLGQLLHRVGQRLQEAGVDGGEALAELGMAQHVGPELKEHRQPAVVAVAPLDRGRGQPVERLLRAGLAQARCHLGQRPLDPPLIDGEEQVLFGGEVGVHRTLGVAGPLGDLVHRGGMEAAADKARLGRREQLLAGLLAPLGPGQPHRHTITIPYTIGIDILSV